MLVLSLHKSGVRYLTIDSSLPLIPTFLWNSINIIIKIWYFVRLGVKNKTSKSVIGPKTVHNCRRAVMKNTFPSLPAAHINGFLVFKNKMSFGLDQSFFVSVKTREHIQCHFSSCWDSCEHCKTSDHRIGSISFYSLLLSLNKTWNIRWRFDLWFSLPTVVHWSSYISCESADTEPRKPLAKNRNVISHPQADGNNCLACSKCPWANFETPPGRGH